MCSTSSSAAMVPLTRPDGFAPDCGERDSLIQGRSHERFSGAPGSTAAVHLSWTPKP